jgi:3-oxoacyl-[acyl-carrier-protein] synthase III
VTARRRPIRPNRVARRELRDNTPFQVTAAAVMNVSLTTTYAREAMEEAVELSKEIDLIIAVAATMAADFAQVAGVAVAARTITGPGPTKTVVLSSSTPLYIYLFWL